MGNLYDGLGSTTDLTDGGGNSVASYGYGLDPSTGLGQALISTTDETSGEQL